ncbi:hypothetical protein Dred_1805 [Desulforamulus reducens MI-1]|uniref:Uncharacterized protein n=1 Tax=Desulforamulus reducens (strain ATCC BAA-1160 / DSM 100696 / MI-1) TaxID=349161 RepID=A4J5H7_DESRM|nr:hypothetical protein [Desulforamulus reducens]ABO50330.1 hypothetical protein Dred_1805 [Desulforamulus reducens MI-1]
MDEKEQLYVNLMMDHLPEDCEVIALKKQGYLTENMQFTQKAHQYVEDFLASKKEAVFLAIIELGPEARKSSIMKYAGIKQMGVLADVVNRLVVEGKVKKENGKFYILA